MQQTARLRQAKEVSAHGCIRLLEKEYQKGNLASRQEIAWSAQEVDAQPRQRLAAQWLFSQAGWVVTRYWGSNVGTFIGLNGGGTSPAGFNGGICWPQGESELYFV